MQPPDPHGAVDAALLKRVRDWCEAGASAGLTAPLAVAGIAPGAALDGVACELDGSHALARLGRWRGLMWRLQILWRDQRAWPGPHPDQPWDCGWCRDGALAAASAFRPRRATLLLVRDPGAAVMQPLLAALAAHGARYTRPMRVLVVSDQPLRDVPPLPG